MNNQQEKHPPGQKRLSMIYRNPSCIMSGVGIALSAIFTQAFIGTGITDNLMLYSLVCFSIAIPLLLLHIFIASLEKGLRGNFAPTVLFIFFSFGGLFCLSGIVLTFFSYHRSQGSCLRSSQSLVSQLQRFL